MPWRWGPVFAACVAVLYMAANTLALSWYGWWLHLLMPLGTIAINQSAHTLYRLHTEERHKRAIRRAFQYYLHPAVVEQVAQHPEQLALGGHTAELTVLFSDIRGFSSFAEGLAPEALVQLLNDYFSAMTQAVFQHQGMVDKYIGDAIMAVYGAPVATPEHAYLACCTALQMLALLPPLQAQWQARSLPIIDVGIGIHTGEMVVGNMGSTTRFNYTVMGDAVNLGARLEGANKTFGTHILISDTTWEHVHERLATRELDVICVKGKAQPTRIYELLGTLPLPPAHALMVERFQAGLQAYRARQWSAALDCFHAVLCILPDDAPSQMYVQRCALLQAFPPGDDWDGVYSMPTK
jgi:adenylate cyclase